VVSQQSNSKAPGGTRRIALQSIVICIRDEKRRHASNAGWYLLTTDQRRNRTVRFRVLNEPVIVKHGVQGNNQYVETVAEVLRRKKKSTVHSARGNARLGTRRATQRTSGCQNTSLPSIDASRCVWSVADGSIRDTRRRRVALNATRQLRDVPNVKSILFPRHIATNQSAKTAIGVAHCMSQSPMSNGGAFVLKRVVTRKQRGVRTNYAERVWQTMDRMNRLTRKRFLSVMGTPATCAVYRRTIHHGRIPGIQRSITSYHLPWVGRIQWPTLGARVSPATASSQTRCLSEVYDWSIHGLPQNSKQYVGQDTPLPHRGGTIVTPGRPWTTPPPSRVSRQVFP
jgi:hypothetical protein